jgi:hypothetical protein
MKKYGVDGIGKGADRKLIKEQLLDAFRKEIFDTSVMMVGPQVFYDNYEASEKDRNKLNNILKNCNNKWKSLCKEFAKYRETCDLIYDDDLMVYMNDRDEALKKKDSTEYYEDLDVEEDPDIEDGSIIVERDENGKAIAGRYPMNTSGEQQATDVGDGEATVDE